jgi:hypothetical protein
MAQALDPIDTVLAELRQDLGNTLTVINIVVALRGNQPQLLQLLRDMLDELSQHIEASLPAIPEEDDVARSITHLDNRRMH